MLVRTYTVLALMRAQQITGELLDSINMCWVGGQALGKRQEDRSWQRWASKQTPQITTPQILGLIRLSQIRKFLRFAGDKSPNRKFAHFLRTNLSNLDNLLIGHIRNVIRCEWTNKPKEAEAFLFRTIRGSWLITMRLTAHLPNIASF